MLAVLLYCLFAMLTMIGGQSCLLLLCVWHRRFRKPVRHGHYKPPCKPACKNNRKPDWVVQAVIRLRAYQPDQSFDKLAKTFNRLYAASRKVTVSKSYVHYTVRNHRLAIEQRRKEIKCKKPATMPKNYVWGIDMTGKADAFGRVHAILGILDHGTRHALSLTTLANKSSWTLLGYLCLAIGRFGKPVSIRTDNERCFTSRVFTLGLRCFGIRHQRIDIGCPWQNGRIERFFGTLKQSLNQWAMNDKLQLQLSLDLFRDWYGAVRPHAHLGGATPCEAWNGIDPYACKPRKIEWFEAWDGLLAGYRIRYG